MKKTLLIALVICLSGGFLFATTPPELMNYQGVLRNASDVPIDASVDMVLRFYNDPSAGMLLWEETRDISGSYLPQVVVTNGLFNVQMGAPAGMSAGSEASFTAVFQNNAAVWLAVEINSDGEMGTRIRVASAAYALNSGSSANADTLDGLDSSQFLRSDADDTAGGVITFTAASTDVRGNLVDTSDNVVNISAGLTVVGSNSSAISLNAGNASGGAGGSVSVLAGTGNNAVGGSVSVEAGSSSSWSGFGASADTVLRGGKMENSASYAQVLAQGGKVVTGGTPNSDGGDLYLQGGNAVGPNRNGGDINLTPGAPTGAGSGGVVNVNGTMDFGGGANDDLTAADVTDLTDAGQTTLHTHDITGDGDSRYLRKDVDDTALGNIEINQTLALGTASTDADRALNVGGYQYGGWFGADQIALWTNVNTTNNGTLYGLRHWVESSDTSTTNTMFGTYAEVNATGSGNDKPVNAIYGVATGAADGTGDHTGVWGVSSNGLGDHYGVRGTTAANSGNSYGVYGSSKTGAGSVYNVGVYGEAANAVTNWGFYTPNNSYVGTDLHVDTGTVGVGTAPDPAYGIRSIYDTGAASGLERAIQGYANASASGNSVNGIGVSGVAIGHSTSTGNHIGVSGQANSAGASGTREGVFGQAIAGTGTENYGGNFWGRSDRASGVVYGAKGLGEANALSNAMTAYGLFGEGQGSSGSSGEVYGVYGTTNTGGGSHYGVYGDANGGGTNTYGVYGNAVSSGGTSSFGVYGAGTGAVNNWGIYTPGRSYVGTDFEVHGNTSIGDAAGDRVDFYAEDIRMGDDTIVMVNGSGATVTYEGNNLRFRVGSSSTDFLYAYNLWPGVSAQSDIGISTTYFDNIYGNDIFYKNLASFDIYPDLDLIDNMRTIMVMDPETRQLEPRVDPATIPAIIRGTNTPDDPEADQFILASRADGLLFGAVRELRQERRTSENALREELNLRTPDPETGIQDMEGSLQIRLDRDGNEASRFSVFRDGKGGIGSEVLRLDERGNLRIKGALMPNALDLAEFHPVSEIVEAGDVLVADRFNPGKLRRSSVADDRAVVGIVTTRPGVVLGAGLDQVAASNPELADSLDLARTRGDKDLENALWQELETRFNAGHAAIALSGTVPCKVDAGYGAIEVGDLLVASDTPGHAKRSDDPAPGTVIGKALGTLESGTGMVRVLVMLR